MIKFKGSRTLSNHMKINPAKFSSISLTASTKNYFLFKQDCKAANIYAYWICLPNTTFWSTCRTCSNKMTSIYVCCIISEQFLLFYIKLFGRNFDDLLCNFKKVDRKFAIHFAIHVCIIYS